MSKNDDSKSVEEPQTPKGDPGNSGFVVEPDLAPPPPLDPTEADQAADSDDSKG